MSIIKKIDDDLIKALKGGEKEKTTVLRGLKSDLKYKKIELGKELSESDVIDVISGVAKKIKDSIEQYSNAGREDLAEKEERELEILQDYLPQQLTEEELRLVIEESIKESGAEGPQQMGLVMKVLMPKIKGKADGKLASKLATEILAK